MTPMAVERQQLADEWRAIEREGENARQALTASPPGIARHVPFNRVLWAQQRCRELLHRWLGSAVHVEAVTDPGLVLSLDVDALVEIDGLAILQRELALDGLPQTVMGSESNDVPLLRSVTLAFLPAASVPSYRPPRQQRLVRSRHVGEAALWDVACWLVPNPELQARVLDAVGQLELPEWFPSNVVWRPELGCTRPPAVKDAATAFAHPNGTLR